MDHAPGSSPWHYDEFFHAGVDYGDERVALDYDERHARFRNVEQDARLIIDRLGLAPDDVVIDLGCGSGAFALTAARHFRRIHAVDVSRAMLGRLEEKARSLGIENIQTEHAGFLTYKHPGEPAAAVVTVAALHHLPDFWKAVALDRLTAMIRPGGRLYLFDVIFSFPPRDHQDQLDGWVRTIRAGAGEEMAAEAVIHIRDEHSTFEWIMDGLLTRAGFRIERKFADFPQCLAILCTRV